MSERPRRAGALTRTSGLEVLQSVPPKRRSMEPVAAWQSCKWLSRCAGADAVHELWTELGMWSSPLHAALRLPRFGQRYPCQGCPIFTTSEDDVA
jgi:hypothetical protein